MGKTVADRSPGEPAWRDAEEGAPEVFVVGQTLAPYDGTVWELVGVFRTEERAVAACLASDYFVMPVRLDDAAPVESVVNYATWYPHTEERPTAEWDCDACGAGRGIHIDAGLGAVESARLVREAHAQMSPDCRVEGTRRIRVRRLSGWRHAGSGAPVELVAAVETV